MLPQILSAVAYGTASILIIFANKIVLTSYSFPSFQILALGQLSVTLFGLLIADALHFIKLPEVNLTTTNKIMPLPVLYFGNLLFGLGGTKSLNLPMFTALRRFSVLMTMYGELLILKTQKPFKIQISIYLMVIGAVIAAYDDLSFDLFGYIYIFLNDIFTAANGIYTKDKLNNSKLGENGLLYYNSLLSIVPLLCLSTFTGEINKLDSFTNWYSFGFWSFFFFSSVMGFLLNYSCMLCTKYNSPLTTTVIGCLKNIFVTYFGMFVGGDYIFSNLNFIGLSLSAFSSIFYAYLTFKKPSSPIQKSIDSESKELKTNNDIKQMLKEIQVKTGKTETS